VALLELAVSVRLMAGPFPQTQRHHATTSRV
jgi:hypothetical protein